MGAMAKQDITIYYTSDLHGHFYPTTYGDKTQRALGLFRCAPGFVKTPNTLVIDGGDTLQGSPFTAYCVKELRSARPVAEIMNRCGYDVVTLGNHDFNYGADYLREYLTQGNFACVCENLKDETGKSIFPRLVKVMENGLRVGIVGIVTDHVNIWEKPENLAGVQVTSPLEAAREALAALRQEADLTICIYHGGFERDLRTGRLLSSSGENIAYQLCQELDFDILLTGHQHLSLPGRLLHGTFALQCADNGREYHRLEVSVQDGKPVIRSQAVAAQAPPDPELMQAFSGLEAQVQHWLDQSVGSLPYPLHTASQIIGGGYYTAVFHSLYRTFISNINLNAGILIAAFMIHSVLHKFRQSVFLFKCRNQFTGLGSICKLRILKNVCGAAGIDLHFLIIHSYGLSHCINNTADHLAMDPRLFLHPRYHSQIDFFNSQAIQLCIQQQIQSQHCLLIHRLMKFNNVVLYNITFHHYHSKKLDFCNSG